jgi:hypothetical protein
MARYSLMYFSSDCICLPQSEIVTKRSVKISNIEKMCSIIDSEVLVVGNNIDKECSAAIIGDMRSLPNKNGFKVLPAIEISPVGSTCESHMASG